eukprot:2979481-Amphidinium_carterae.2
MKVPTAPTDEEKRNGVNTVYADAAAKSRRQAPRAEGRRPAGHASGAAVVLAATDNVYHRTMAVWVPLKGADEYAVKSIRFD